MFQPPTLSLWHNSKQPPCKSPGTGAVPSETECKQHHNLYLKSTLPILVPKWQICLPSTPSSFSQNWVKVRHLTDISRCLPVYKKQSSMVTAVLSLSKMSGGLLETVGAMATESESGCMSGWAVLHQGMELWQDQLCIAAMESATRGSLSFCSLLPPLICYMTLSNVLPFCGPLYYIWEK